MNMKIPGLLTAVLLGATLSGSGLAQNDDGRPGFGRGHGPHAGTEGFAGRRFGMRAPSPARVLDQLDADGDAMISLEEFTTGRLAEVDRIFDRLDRDGNGLVSAGEREGGERPQRGRRRVDREAMAECVSETVGELDPAGVSGARFDNADTNGDGELDLAEMSEALEQGARAQFARLDTDADGFLGEDELQARHDARLELRRELRSCARQSR